MTRLLDLGFEEDITSIVKIASSRSKVSRIQKILASATLRKKGMNVLVHSMLESPIPVGFDEKEVEKLLLNKTKPGSGEAGAEEAAVDEREQLMEAVDNIPAGLRQEYIQVAEKQRLAVLIGFLRGCIRFARQKQLKKERKKRGFSADEAFDESELQLETPKAIVFCNTTLSVEFHHKLLKRLTWPPQAGEITRLAENALGKSYRRRKEELLGEAPQHYEDRGSESEHEDDPATLAVDVP